MILPTGNHDLTPERLKICDKDGDYWKLGQGGFGTVSGHLGPGAHCWAQAFGSESRSHAKYAEKAVCKQVLQVKSMCWPFTAGHWPWDQMAGLPQVYKALLDSSEPVAVKFLNPSDVAIGNSVSSREKFESEIQLMRLCWHENIVTFIGACVQQVCMHRAKPAFI